ncbi:hypothetical protein F3Y22_tig00110290pilonHSYRG00025 [Hibiscus syriacus]|uniref:MADS-box domain-containing protein n=1 Tax=Hibiscus syriacus TaxID=106335 RepID=A0A6A3B4N6_HIBSY|nr:hypothetical protein F3Y22_tig00110290pilonHSYRG00025 [Hibiscus syriacus]
MRRKNVELVYITNDAIRKSSYRKRKKGLMKRVSELSTLCGVEADPRDGTKQEEEGEPREFPYPKDHKASEQLTKQCKINREKELTHVMFQNLMGNASIEGLNMMDLNDLGWLMYQNLKEIEKRIDTLSQTSYDPQGSYSSVAGTPSTMSEAMPRTSLGDSVQTEANNMYSMQGQHWTMELMNNNPQSHVGFGGYEMVSPFGDNINVNNNAFFARIICLVLSWRGLSLNFAYVLSWLPVACLNALRAVNDK